MDRKGPSYFKNFLSKGKETSVDDEDYLLISNLYEEMQEQEFQQFSTKLVAKLRQSNVRLNFLSFETVESLIFLSNDVPINVIFT